MKIYMLAEHDELDEIAEALLAQIAEWQKEQAENIQLLSPSEESLDVGIMIETSKKFALKDPVNFLYQLAKENKAEFVVGVQADDGSRENICFFGYEEGRPDINEIGQYLGLKR